MLDAKAFPSITVKLMARMPPDSLTRHFGRQLPQATKSWGDCRFVFAPEARDYDWLVVYHDIYRPAGGPGLEELACPRSRTILVTTEPSSITVYGTDYLRQYGTIITSQEPWVFNHPRVIFTQPGLIWFYGFPFGEGPLRTYDKLQATPPPAKSKLIATVCSSRAGGLTLHRRRVRFTHKLQAELPELDVFGHGVRPMSDKAEALDPYQYHIAIENHVFRHHLTEKLPDAFLGYTLPFYHGCPNATDYFPRESFIPINIGDFDRTLDIIRSTIANNEYRDRLPYIIESRRRVLEEHNLFAVLERYIRVHSGEHEDPGPSGRAGAAVIMNRQTLRRKKPLIAVKSLIEKGLVKGRHYL